MVYVQTGISLFIFYNDIDEWEMFDLENDPQEMNNIADKSEFKDVRKELELELKKLQVLYSDTIPEKRD